MVIHGRRIRHEYCRQPDRRAAAIRQLGEKLYKSAFTMFSVAAVAFMVMGYQKAVFIEAWTPPDWTMHLNNLLMLLAVLLMGAKQARSSVKHYIRHPMLAGVKVWAVAHLLVNGDLASVILFGGLGFWAVAEMFLINSAEGAWKRPAPGTLKGDIKNGIITLVIFVVVAGIHFMLGHSPFMGTYG